MYDSAFQFLNQQHYISSTALHASGMVVSTAEFIEIPPFFPIQPLLLKKLFHIEIGFISICIVLAHILIEINLSSLNWKSLNWYGIERKVRCVLWYLYRKQHECFNEEYNNNWKANKGLIEFWEREREKTFVLCIRDRKNIAYLSKHISIYMRRTAWYQRFILCDGCNMTQIRKKSEK